MRKQKWKNLSVRIGCENLRDEKAKMEESLRKDIEKLKDEKAKMEESLRKDIENLRDEKAKMEANILNLKKVFEQKIGTRY